MNTNFFQNNLSGTISKKIKDIADKSQELFNVFRFDIIGSVITVIISLFFLYLASPKIASLFSLYLFFTFLFGFFISKKIHFLSKNYTKQNQKVSGLITDSISNIASVFLFASKEEKEDL